MKYEKDVEEIYRGIS